MKQRKQRGVVQVLVLAVLVLLALSVLVRCDINNTRTEHKTTTQEQPDEMETNDRRTGHDLAGDDAVL